jgi:hypothetical protein
MSLSHWLLVFLAPFSSFWGCAHSQAMGEGSSLLCPAAHFLPLVLGRWFWNENRGGCRGSQQNGPPEGGICGLFSGINVYFHWSGKEWGPQTWEILTGSCVQNCVPPVSVPALKAIIRAPLILLTLPHPNISYVRVEKAQSSESGRSGFFSALSLPAVTWENHLTV